jgi:hypothetical protein
MLGELEPPRAAEVHHRPLSQDGAFLRAISEILRCRCGTVPGVPNLSGHGESSQGGICDCANTSLRAR